MRRKEASVSLEPLASMEPVNRDVLKVRCFATANVLFRNRIIFIAVLRAITVKTEENHVATEPHVRVEHVSRDASRDRFCATANVSRPKQIISIAVHLAIVQVRIKGKPAEMVHRVRMGHASRDVSRGKYYATVNVSHRAQVIYIAVPKAIAREMTKQQTITRVSHVVMVPHVNRALVNRDVSQVRFSVMGIV